MKETDSKHRIQYLIDTLGINQTEFCRRCGLNKSALSNYLNGDREPRQDKISQIADAFGVDPGWLMGHNSQMYIDNRHDIKLSLVESDIIRAFRNASDGIQDSVLKLLDIEKRDTLDESNEEVTA